MARTPWEPFIGELFVFAGIWDRWRSPDGTVETCSILWLDPGMRDVSMASELLKPYDARLMRCYPISTRINHVANDDEACSTPVELAQTQARLFS